MSTLTIDYDVKNDILYVSIGEPIPSISYEIDEGIEVRKSMDNGQITGVTILDYKYRKQRNMKIEVPGIDLSTINI